MEVMITARYILQYTNLHRIEFLLRNVRLQLFHQDLIIIDKKLIITLRQNFISIKFESLSIFTNQTFLVTAITLLAIRSSPSLAGLSREIPRPQLFLNRVQPFQRMSLNQAHS